MITEEQMNVIAGLNDFQEAQAILESFKAQAHLAAQGNMVMPQYVPSWQLVLEYARLRLLAVAILTGDSPAAVSALASAPGFAASPVLPAAANGASPLILPGR